MTPSPPPKKKPSCDDPQKMSTISSYPKKYSFLKTPKNTEIQMSEPQNSPSLSLHENIKV